MAKSKERLLARKLRKDGYSVKTISRQLKVSRSSISIWVRDITLTPDQLRILNQNSIDGRDRGRTTTSLMYQARRQRIHDESVQYANNIIGILSKQEFLIAGIALYWAEGNKKTHSVRFTNSDPQLITFALNWLKYVFNLPIERIGAFVGINESHKSREGQIIQYWSSVTGIPISHFKKSIMKKSINKKVYENSNMYYGTLTIFVWKATNIYYKIMGLIEVLSKNNQLPI